MAAAARNGPREMRLTDDRIEDADREGQRGGRRIPAGGAVELLRPPCRIAQQVERLPRENRRNLVVPMPVGRRPRENRDDDLRPEPPDDVDHVFEDRVAGPEAERLLDRLGKAEIVRAREELAGGVPLRGGEQLFRLAWCELWGQAAGP